MVTRDLLVLSLGPVQEFIAAGRRCQDLWYGSWLLSELGRAAAAEVENIAGAGALVFPGDLKDREASVANVILAEVPQGGAGRVAEAARDAMQARLRELATRAFGRIDGSDERYFERGMALKQVEELMEFHWVSAPCPAGSYATVRRRLMAALAARKNTKTWGPVGWHPPSGIPKSSIDGLRESVLNEDLYESGDAGALRRFFVKRSERLCGVALMKRLGLEEMGEERSRPAFHSTSHVAAGPALVRIATQPDGQPKLDEYIRKLEEIGVDLGRLRIRAGKQERYSAARPAGVFGQTAPASVRRVLGSGEDGFDGVLLFPERLPDILETESTLPPEGLRDGAEAARGALGGLLKALGLSDEGPCPYYVLLAADGDRMGKAIDLITDVKVHRRFSGAVEQFALGCREVVESHGGSSIYAGGDDVLALVPLHTALDCASMLREKFREAIEEGAPHLPESGKPTLSVGLAVCHHLDPMTEARALAQSAEALAKQRRDSLAIVVSKRSGPQLEVTASWGEDLAGRLDGWCALLRSGALPHGAAFDIEAALAPFSVPNAATGQVAEPDGALVSALVHSVLRRKTEASGGEISSETQGRLTRVLSAPAAGGPAPRERALALAAEIQIARLFLRAYEDAWGEERP
jgi:CRISPR-associated protein Cmr2